MNGASSSHPTGDAPMEAEVFREDDQEAERSSCRLVLPADGYEWKKYGQKFIKNIGMLRSYFKCQRMECGAKKRAEWSTTQPSNIKVVYDGNHSHDQYRCAAGSAPSPLPNSSTASTASNQYNLYTQVFGDQQVSSIRHHGSN